METSTSTYCSISRKRVAQDQEANAVIKAAPEHPMMCWNDRLRAVASTLPTAITRRAFVIDHAFRLRNGQRSR